MKKALIIFIGIIVILFIAILLVPRLIDWNSRIAAMVKESTGRELTINGDVSISILPSISFSASDIHLSNAPGMKAPEMLSVGAVSGKLRLWPLLSSRVVVDSFIISEPSVHLEVDKTGRQNWVFEKEGQTPPEPEKKYSKKERTSEGDAGLPISDLVLGDVRIDKGQVSFANAISGQTIKAKDINMETAIQNLGSPFTLAIRLILNDEPVTVDLLIDSLKNIETGMPLKVKSALDTKFISTGFEGSVQQKPVPGLDGDFNLNIPSVGQLAAWLDQPLKASQPDPGPLKMQAVFTGEGARVTLKEATIEGKTLNVRATGGYDGSGDIAKVALNVESGILDIDQYMPPPAPPVKKKTVTRKRKQSPSGSPLAALSDNPFDLTALRNTEADVKINIGGIKAMGYEIGQVVFTTDLKNGLLTADLSKLALYGGNVKGTVKLDGSGEALGVDAKMNIDSVKVDKLARAASKGESPVAGVASASLNAAGRGVSPKALVESLSGKVVFDLGGMDVKDVSAGDISGIKVDLDVPGLESSPALKGSVVYNKRRVNLDLTLDPLKKVLSGKPFALKAAVASKLVNLNYDGKVQQQPVPGLDGKFNLDVPSVGKLAAWLDKPLDKSQPDPGPLKVRAAFETDGAKASLKEVAIEGKAIEVNASGSFDGTGKVPFLTAKVNVVNADLNAYLPKSEPKEKAAPKKEEAPPKEPAGWSEEPFDFSPLSKANGDIEISIGSLRYGDLTIKPGLIKAALDNGLLKASIEELKASGGNMTAAATINTSGQTATFDYQANISGIEARPLLKTFAGFDRLSGKAELQAKGKAQGNNQKELIGSLNGDSLIKFLDGAIHGINIAATLRKAKSLGFDKEKAGESQKTDFAELSGSFVIKNGVVENHDFKMLAPLLRLGGEGTVPLPDQTVDYKATAKLVATLKGQGEQDALAGLPIPVRIKGPWSNVSYEVDWKSVLSEISLDPERLKNLPKGFQDIGKNMGIDLPISEVPDVGGVGDVIKTLPGLLKGDEKTGEKAQAEKNGGGLDLFKQILQPETKSEEQPATEPTTKETEKKEAPSALEPLKQLKGLFGK